MAKLTAALLPIAMVVSSFVYADETPGNSQTPPSQQQPAEQQQPPQQPTPAPAQPAKKVVAPVSQIPINDCRRLVVSTENANFLPKAAAYMQPLIGQDVMIELTPQEFQALPMKVQNQGQLSETGHLIRGRLADYNTSGALATIRIDTGGKSYTFSTFIATGSAQAFGQGQLPKNIDELNDIYRLRDIQIAENAFDDDALVKLKTELDGVINSLAHEKEFSNILNGRWGVKLAQKWAGAYADRTWIDREMMRDELKTFIREGNISNAAGKFQEIFTKVETAAVVLLRLRPLHEALKRLANEKPELQGEISGALTSAEKVMDQQAEILGWNYGDYKALRAQLDELIESKDRALSDGATDMDNQMSQKTNNSIQSLISRLGIYRISETHFPVLFRNTIDFDSADGVDWVTRAYYGEPNPGSLLLPYAAMLPRRTTVRRYAFDNMINAFMNTMTHPLLLNMVLAPIDAVPSNPSLVNPVGNGQGILNSVLTFLKRVPVAITHIPRKYFDFVVEFLRERRSAYVHGPDLKKIIAQLNAAGEVNLEVLETFQNMTSSHGKGVTGIYSFLVSAAQDPRFSNGAWVQIRNFVEKRTKTDQSTVVLKQFYDDMITAEKEAAKLGYTNNSPVSGLDFFLKVGGSYLVFEITKWGYASLDAMGIMPF